VMVIEARPGARASVESIPLSSGRRLRDLDGTLAEVLAAGRATPDEYLRVRVRVEAPLPGVAEQVREALPHALDVSLAYERKVWEPPAAGSRAALQPNDLFRAFYRARHEAEPPPELLQLFERIHEEALRS
jgi:DNA repair protein SbcD/Mre11